MTTPVTVRPSADVQRTPDLPVPPAVCPRSGAGYSSGFADRVLPSFHDIEAEADAASEAYFNSRMNQMAGEDGPWEDEGAVAEYAQEHGLSVYTDLEFVRQQVTGLAIAGLYHLWERLVKEFLETSFRAVDPPVTPQTVRRADFKCCGRLAPGALRMGHRGGRFLC